MAAHSSDNHSCLGHRDLNTLLLDSQPIPTGLAQFLHCCDEKRSLCIGQLL